MHEVEQYKGNKMNEEAIQRELACQEFFCLLQTQLFNAKCDQQQCGCFLAVA